MLEVEAAHFDETLISKKMENKTNKFAVVVANMRPLSIDFDQYTDGDAEFKNELIVLMIDNIKELKESLAVATKAENSDGFRKTCHKVKPTLCMIDDAEYNDIIEVLKCQVSNQNCITIFNNLSDNILRNLEAEIG
jgi:hypothetical protein